MRSFRIFVQRGAHVHVAIGEGRAVMQDEGRACPSVSFMNALIQAACLPLGQALRFPRDKVRLHGEVGLRQADGVFVVLLGRGLGAHDGKWSAETRREQQRGQEG